MISKPQLRTHLRDILADESTVMSDAELDKLIDLAVTEYSLISPYVVDTTLTTTEGTVNYALQSGVITVYDVLNTANTSVSYIQSGQVIRFETNPAGQVYTVRAAVVHVINTVDGTYPTIPEYDFQSLLSLAQANMLERVADDILRRPDITVGQTRETWGRAAEVMYQRAKDLRARVTGSIGDEYFFTG